MSTAPSPIDWERAERVALGVAARRGAAGRGAAAFRPIALAPAQVIEDAIESVTGLRPAHGPAEIRFLDRASWIRSNLDSFRTLLQPMLEQWASSTTLASSSVGLGRQVAGAEIGALLGWMSTRVLGQYDILISRDPGDDAVYMVGPNLASLEQRYGFAPAEFRTWVLFHELTHRAQFTGVPWMRDHFTGLVEQSLSFANPDLNAFTEALRSALRNRREAGSQVRDGGMFGLLASPEQREVMARIGGLMSLLEGHGDVTMTRAAGHLVPNAERFERILRERRRSSNPLSRTIMRLAGIEAKLNQYAAGTRFITMIEEASGERAVDPCWDRPENLPSLEEVRAPHLWLARMATVGA